MNIDTYEHQYPPELYQLLLDAIPKLCRSKNDVPAFFTNCGVDDVDLFEIRRRLRVNREGTSKHDMADDVLTRLCNKRGAGLGVRRAVLQRVYEWEDFTPCWDDDRRDAELLVAKIQKFVDKKDSVTRNRQTEDEQRRIRAEEARRKIEAKQRFREDNAAIRTDLISLYSEANAPKRGKTLESVLNRLFKLHGLHSRDPFTLRGTHDEGILEQIDGVIEIDGQYYLVEMKWLSERVDVVAVDHHSSRLQYRAEAKGIFIAEPGYTKAAIARCKEVLKQKLIVLCELREIVLLLDKETPLKDFLKAKIQAAVIDKNPLYYPLSSSYL